MCRTWWETPKTGFLASRLNLRPLANCILISFSFHFNCNFVPLNCIILSLHASTSSFVSVNPLRETSYPTKSSLFHNNMLKRHHAQVICSGDTAGLKYRDFTSDESRQCRGCAGVLAFTPIHGFKKNVTIALWSLFACTFTCRNSSPSLIFFH